MDVIEIVEFQFLIGSLEAQEETMKNERELLFQFLIGSLEALF